MNASLEHALRPARLGGLELRNRIIKSATYEGMSPGGRPSSRLVEHHARLARGGVGLTTVAYAAVASRGQTFSEQLVMDERSESGLKQLTAAVHEEGGAASVQLAHCGGFTKNRRVRPLGPSWGLNLYGMLSGLPLVRPMGPRDLVQVVEDFRRAAGFAVEVGFDAVEVHLGHGYLLSQFLSPKTNRRRDAWGGSALGRLRLPLEVIDAVRCEVGADVPILAKINLSDGLSGGLEVEDAIVVGRALQAAGVDALVMSGGVVDRNALWLLRGGRPLRRMIEVEKSIPQKCALALFGPFLVQRYPFQEMFFLPLARRLRAALSIPLVLLGGLVSGDNIAQAMDERFEFVAMARALLSNPELVRELESGMSRARCVHCNLCIAEMDEPNGVRCVL